MSNNTYYNIYLNNNIELAYSMIIKLECVATAMNRESEDLGLPVLHDKRTWRYYKHLSGQYHSLDVEMTVRSLDNGEEIVFNAENIRHHKKTRSIYKSERNYVEDLISRYPSQSNLIRGILYPINIDTAINALDGTILYHNPNYVEGQELNLIYDTEAWIRSVQYRTEMQSYSETDDLFIAGVVGLIYANLTNALMDIRLKYVKTAQAHSFHISSYLASYNRLDEFIPYLTFEQQLFLYMNINYIVRHTGMVKTFELLLEKLLTIRNLPVYDYNLRQANIALEDGRLQPYPLFTRDKLNLNSGLTTRNLDTRDIPSVLYKEVSQAINNLSMLGKYTDDAEMFTERSSISKIPSKILEVSAIDPEDVEPSKLPDVMINEWAYHASNGTYTNSIELINPLNGDVIKIDICDAFVLYLYAYAKGFLGIAMVDIPPYLAYNVAKYHWIPESEYLAIAEQDTYDNWERDIDFFMMSNLELTENIAIASEFMERCDTLNTRRCTRYQWVENKRRYQNRAANMAFFNYSYFDQWCNIDKGNFKTYENFFMQYAINAERIDNEMWKDIAMDCLDKATDFASTNKISLRDIQANMVKLFKRLSSYTIQFLEEIASEDVAIANSIIVIPGNTGQSTDAEAFVPNPTVTMLSHRAESQYEINVINSPIDVLYVEMDNNVAVDAVIGVDADVNSATEANVVVEIGQAKVIDIEMDINGAE